MKFIDLFAGIGGFRLGLERAGHQNVWSNEFDKYASQTYVKNFGEKNHDTRDIRQVPSEEIPDHDLLCGGFPCQPFSIAGRRKGTQEERGTLFDEIVRIARDKKPKMLFLENVKGLLSAEKGYSFYYILSRLDELGYDVEWQVLNSKYFGVPQNRERVFIIGHLRGESTRKIFPFKEDAGQISRLFRTKEVSPVYQKDGSKTSEAHRIYDSKGVSPAMKNQILIDNETVYETGKFGEEYFRSYEKGTPTLQQSMGTGGNNVPMIVAQRGRNPNKPNDRTTGANLEQTFEPNSQSISNTLSSVEKDNYVALNPSNFKGKSYVEGNIAIGLSEPSGNNQTLINDKLIRRLTPKECERLQGFPDNWSEGVSDTQRYKQLGNAVTVNVIEYIGKKLIE